METNIEKQMEFPEKGRRGFIKQGLVVSLSGVAGFSMFEGCKDKSEKDEGQKVTPAEDLMQEHGLLNRVLLIYDKCRASLVNKETFPKNALGNAAGIIRIFVEDFHEKHEENYLFPRFQKANTLTDLVDVLLQQHKAGRTITDRIIQLTKTTTTTENENQKLIKLLSDFNTMYRPHEAREDTILFPAFRKIISSHEYDSLGEEFEKDEEKIFGKNGFESLINKVETIEKSIGIYALSKFTPIS